MEAAEKVCSLVGPPIGEEKISETLEAFENKVRELSLTARPAPAEEPSSSSSGTKAEPPAPKEKPTPIPPPKPPPQFPELDQFQAEKVHKLRGGKVYGIIGPEDARGVWIGSWLRIATAYPGTWGSSKPSVQDALRNFQPDEQGRIRIRTTHC